VYILLFLVIPGYSWLSGPTALGPWPRTSALLRCEKAAQDLEGGEKLLFLPEQEKKSLVQKCFL